VADDNDEIDGVDSVDGDPDTIDEADTS